jgi:hypothetical protein
VPGSASRPAPQYANATAGAKPLVIHFFVLIQKKDVAGLDSFLSPAFQVQRADGSSSDKVAYLAKLPFVNRFWLSNLAATQAGPALVARYLARAEGIVNGKPYTPGPAPRLSAPDAYSTGDAIARFAGGGYFQPAAVAGTVALGTNIGAYHLVCNLTAAGHPNGLVIDDGGDVYDSTYVAAYVGYWGTPVGLYPIYS